MSRADNYKEVTGCHSCKHLFLQYEYDDGATHYCTHDAPPRPLCGSLAMGEDFERDRNLPSELRHTDQDPWSVAMDKWEEWMKGREVAAYGICDCYEEAKKKDKKKTVSEEFDAAIKLIESVVEKNKRKNLDHCIIMRYESCLFWTGYKTMLTKNPSTRMSKRAVWPVMPCYANLHEG